MDNRPKVIDADYRTSGKTYCITQLIIGKPDCFVRIFCLPHKRIVITEEMSKKILEAWENGHAVNLLIGSLNHLEGDIVTSQSIEIEVEETQINTGE
jgi:hypothetical protein